MSTETEQPRILPLSSAPEPTNSHIRDREPLDPVDAPGCLGSKGSEPLLCAGCVWAQDCVCPPPPL